MFSLSGPLGFSFGYRSPFDADLIWEEGENKLYLGSMDSVDKWDELEKRNIKQIVSVVDFMEPRFSDKIPYLWIQVQDSYDWNLLATFSVAIQHIEDVLINKKFGPTASVLVHCAAGISRSSTIVIAFLMKLKKMTFMEAWTHAKQRRSFVCPNGSFQEQLTLYEDIGCQLKAEPRVINLWKQRKIPAVAHWYKEMREPVQIPTELF